MDIIATLANELGLEKEKVEKTVALIDEGNTIPFISRYRKEVTGSMDDTTLRALDDRLQYLRKMDERRQEIAALIAAQEKLTPEIEAALNMAKTLVELEDIYRPFKPKRTTRASIARAKGLEPLAQYILEKIRAEVSDVSIIVDSRTAGIHPDFTRVDGGEFLKAASHGIEKAHNFTPWFSY